MGRKGGRAALHTLHDSEEIFHPTQVPVQMCLLPFPLFQLEELLAPVSPAHQKMRVGN